MEWRKGQCEMSCLAPNGLRRQCRPGLTTIVTSSLRAQCFGAVAGTGIETIRAQNGGHSSSHAGMRDRPCSLTGAGHACFPFSFPEGYGAPGGARAVVLSRPLAGIDGARRAPTAKPGYPDPPLRGRAPPLTEGAAPPGAPPQQARAVCANCLPAPLSGAALASLSRATRYDAFGPAR